MTAGPIHKLVFARLTFLSELADPWAVTDDTDPTNVSFVNACDYDRDDTKEM